MAIDYTGFLFGKGAPRAAVKLKQQRTEKAQEAKTRTAVNKRDKHRCFFPNCRERAFHKHHTVYRSKGGRFETENIVSGCPLHHGWVHGGLIRLYGNPDKAPVEIELTTLGREAKIRVPKRKEIAA